MTAPARPYTHRVPSSTYGNGWWLQELVNVEQAFTTLVGALPYAPVYNVAQAPYFARGVPGSEAADTIRIQRAADDAAAAGGGTIYCPKVYAITQPMLSGDFVRWTGGGIGGGGLKAAASWTAVGGLIAATGRTAVAVAMIELDGNAGGGATNAYGIFASGGSRCRYSSCYIHDTTNAGICDLDQQSTVVQDNLFDHCGRAGTTDNHGLMLGSIASTGARNARISGNVFMSTFRKSLTVFAFSPGTTRNVAITTNLIIDGGLGGLYLGGDLDGLCSGFSVDGNVCTGNYTSIFAERIVTLTITGNACAETIGDCNINIQHCSNLTVTANPCRDAAAYNIRLISCTNGVVEANPCGNANGSALPVIGNISLANSSGISVRGNRFEDASGNVQYAILEEGTSDHNVITGNTVSGATTELIHTVGAATVVRDNDGWNPVGPVAVTVTSSPMTYTAGRSPEVLYVKGGTVSGVVKAGVTLATATNVSVLLEPYQAVTITYSAAPTLATDIQ